MPSHKFCQSTRALPVDCISLEMIYRGLYHFSVASQKGLTNDPIKYFAAPENQDLGVLNQYENLMFD